ncbi:MAG: long-chain fatty acid--CoA ligase [Thermoleophilaceae bacterium]|nr:long-chain fatty acid--CoA ligase [Thermoleophilaceae bacterium]
MATEIRPHTATERATGAETIVEMALRSPERHTGPALRFHRDGSWRELSYAELGSEVRALARGLIALGIEPGDRISILSSTRAEWTLADLAALCAGAVVAPIYHTNSPEECEYVLEHAGSRLVFCEDAEQAAKVAEVRGRCPELEHVVVFEGEVEGALSLDDLRAKARSVDPSALEEIARAIHPEDPATIVYTSGTTGPPKGCVTTHANCMSTARMYEDELEFASGDEHVVVFMFLPLAHSLARVTQMVVLDVGGTIAYWRGDPSVVLEDLASTRPTHVPSVPRVYEKVHTKALSGVEEASGLKRAIFHWALGTGAHFRRVEHEGRVAGPLLRARHALADRLVLSKVRGLFGPDIKLALTGAAPISRDVLEFFDACGVLILEGYGMTETTAAATLNTQHGFRFGTVGRALPGSEIAIAEDGEVLMRGPNVFAGYFKNDEATDETMTEDGWLRSGDLGSVDEDGYLHITGRKKDLIITSSGKNISAANLESALRDIRWVSQAVVFGDDRPYIVALLTLDPDEAPALAKRAGVEPDIAQMSTDPRVQAVLAAEVERVNERFARIEQVKRFTILDRDLTQEDGELTPTMKVKRAVVYREFADAYGALYD